MESSRLFTKVIPNLATGTTSAVNLTDTSGVLINCNYINVMCDNSNTAGIGYVYVQPSAIYQGTSLNPSATTLTGSGAGGWSVIPGTSQTVIMPRSVKVLSITNNTGSTKNIIVNYGVAQVNNPLKGTGNVGL